MDGLSDREYRARGDELLRRWVDDPSATPADLDSVATLDEKDWLAEREGVMIYR